MPLKSIPFKVLSLPIGNYKIKIAQIENPEFLFDDFLNKKPEDEDFKDEQIPYWADLWPSAIALSEFLVDNSKLVKDKSVLEIGCGLGLVGIVAAKLGGLVTLTDYLPAALEFAEYNWKLNFKTKADVQLLDWRKPQNILPVDVLLASDIAYESRSFKPLLKALKVLVKKDGLILIGEPNRKFAKEFFTDIKNEGYFISDEARTVFKDGLKNKITIYLLKK